MAGQSELENRTAIFWRVPQRRHFQVQERERVRSPLPQPPLRCSLTIQVLAGKKLRKNSRSE